MNWKQALVWLESLGQFGSRPGLVRINKVLNQLGQPQKGLKIVHVAGTNGKGSVATFISSILTESGYKTGVYTSPHLEEYTERFLIDGVKAAKCELADYMSQVRHVVHVLHRKSGLILTEFEVLTVVAFLYFASHQVDYLVLEVGLGGRLDATNVVVPDLAVITRIGVDHTAVLGDNVAAIAAEKAGIIKAGIPVVMGEQEAEAVAVIKTWAERKKAPLYASQDLVSIYPLEHSLNGQLFQLRVAGRLYENLRIGLLGSHQLENVATAATAWQVLGSGGVHINENGFRQGLEQACWPGRFEVIATYPTTIIIDGGHNLSGAKAVARTVKEYLPSGRVLLVTGVLADKDVDGIVQVLASFASQAIVTTPLSPRAAAPCQVAAKFRGLGVQSCVEPCIGPAIDKALSEAQPGDTVLICGSLYLAGEARRCLKLTLGASF
ncbi:MAG TPA: folylpolyglutamate synthase/dihydrofolate synthase family protein [bacterium]|nr:folylpolyglutamate synthase/dihydrofolate synthase family protein [bacterium]